MCVVRPVHIVALVKLSFINEPYVRFSSLLTVSSSSTHMLPLRLLDCVVLQCVAWRHVVSRRPRTAWPRSWPHDNTGSAAHTLTRASPHITPTFTTLLTRTVCINPALDSSWHPLSLID